VPQAFRRSLHGCGNEIIYLIKYSSLAYVVTCLELTGEGKTIATEYFRFTEVFAIIGLYYLALVTVAIVLLKKVEQRLYIPGFGHH
jgi:polar amino acid transport system permease protein